MIFIIFSYLAENQLEKKIMHLNTKILLTMEKLPK